MKNSNSKIYMTSPISIMASIVASAENSVNPDYQLIAENMVKFYTDFRTESTLAVCDAPCTELMSEKDNALLLNFVYSEFGKINSYTVHKFNNETSVYKLDSSKGNFKMILVLDSENKISAIDFVKVEVCEMSQAA